MGSQQVLTDINKQVYQTFLKTDILQSLPADSNLFKFYSRRENFDKILDPLPLSLSVLEKQRAALENAGLDIEVLEEMSPVEGDRAVGTSRPSAGSETSSGFTFSDDNQCVEIGTN